jgi:hypothetical protein
MANTVNILSFNNTFGDLVAQQNKAAVELNNIGANNYTKDSGTLLLVATGTALSVTNTAILGTAIVSGTSSLLGDVTSAANATFTGSGFAFQVANNAVIAKTLITDSITSNTLVRTGTINASGTAFVNGITSNTLIRTSTLNSNGPAYLDSVSSNTVIFSPIFNSSTSAFFNNLTANNLITTKDLAVTGNITSPTITSSSFNGQATLIGVSTSNTSDANTSNTQIATTGFVKNVLNSGNTFNMAVQNGVVTTGSYSDPSWITSLAGSKISGTITGSSANITNFIVNQNLSTASGVQFNSFGVGTAASGTPGEIRATNNITAYFSDDRLKKRLGNIENALAKVMTLNGFQYEANETAQALGYAVKPEIGLSAQEVQAVLPEVVVPAPIDEQYLTIHYERVIPLLVEAIKELKKEIDDLKLGEWQTYPEK